jgi:hypothetical protein
MWSGTGKAVIEIASELASSALGVAESKNKPVLVKMVEDTVIQAAQVLQ